MNFTKLSHLLFPLQTGLERSFSVSLTIFCKFPIFCCQGLSVVITVIKEDESCLVFGRFNFLSDDGVCRTDGYSYHRK